jgi:hypothetical protein
MQFQFLVSQVRRPVLLAKLVALVWPLVEIRD